MEHSQTKACGSRVLRSARVRNREVFPDTRGEESYGYVTPVSDDSLRRSQIITVQFVDSIENAPADAWDVSADWDGSVLAWIKPREDMYSLMINKSCQDDDQGDAEAMYGFFGGKENTERIIRNGAIEESDFLRMREFAAQMQRDGISFDQLLRVCVGAWNEDAPANAWNISDDKNRTIMAWMHAEDVRYYDLLIGADGGVEANEDSALLFAGYENVRSIRFNGCFDTSRMRDMTSMFAMCIKLKELDLSGFDTSKVTSMCNVFYDCSRLTSLDVSGFDTSKVTNMASMFSHCAGLTSLDVSRFDTSRVTDMGHMFSCCSSLLALDLSRFDTSKVTKMRWMFRSCTSLASLDLSGFETPDLKDMNLMFQHCSGLNSLDIRRFDTTGVERMRGEFRGCSSLSKILVGGKFVIPANAKGMFDGCGTDHLTFVD